MSVYHHNLLTGGSRRCGHSSRESSFLHKACVTTVLLLAWLVVSAAPVQAGEWQYDGAPKVVAIADIHGAHDAMAEAMRAAGVVDEQLSWTAGGAHLVIVGDILDRGPDSRRAMDLLMRLEGEAEGAGGKVHVLIGNHEAMNLVGDLRYVSTSEYAAFADEETAEERERWFQEYARARAPADQGPEGLATVFRQKFPAGFFAHRRAFGSDGKYGAWLLSKPAVVVINDTAFVHGGLSPMIGQIGLEGVNTAAERKALAGKLLEWLAAGTLPVTPGPGPLEWALIVLAVALCLLPAPSPAADAPAGYTVLRRVRAFGKWIDHGGWFPEWRVRLFRKDAGVWEGVDPHYDIVVRRGTVGRLRGEIVHYTYDDLSDHIHTVNRFSSVLAREHAARGRARRDHHQSGK